MKVELNNISLSFGSNKVLNSLSLTFEDGKLSCLLGRSGSGKTSILKIIAGISPPFTGDVIFDNNIVTDKASKDRNVGWVPQQQLIFPGLDVRGNVSYGLKARKISREQQNRRIKEVANLVGLQDLLDRDPTGLSGGERQRVALGRALAPKPDILLLDEPFSSLDAPERDRLSLAFREIQIETGVTTIHVTHAPREAELLSDHVKILSSGSILQKGDFNELIERPNSTEVAKLLNLPNVIEPNELNGIEFPAIIPSEAIILNQGDLVATILAITKEILYLKVQGVRLQKKITSSNLRPGTTINLEIEWDEIKPISE